jgi:hypothetical protein
MPRWDHSTTMLHATPRRTREIVPPERAFIHKSTRVERRRPKLRRVPEIVMRATITAINCGLPAISASAATSLTASEFRNTVEPTSHGWCGQPPCIPRARCHSHRPSRQLTLNQQVTCHLLNCSQVATWTILPILSPRMVQAHLIGGVPEDEITARQSDFAKFGAAPASIFGPKRPGDLAFLPNISAKPTIKTPFGKPTRRSGKPSPRTTTRLRPSGMISG